MSNVGNWLKVAFDTIKVFILFTGCTLLFYFGMMWLNQEYENYHRYDRPGNGAIEVTKSVSEKDNTMIDRLMLFYRLGE